MGACVTGAVPAQTLGQPQRSRRAAVVAATILALSLVTIASVFGFRALADDPPSGSQANAGTIAEFSCPAFRDGDLASSGDQSAGALVPPGADKALLCTYDYTADPMPLKESALLEASADAVAQFLNTLPGQPEDGACLAMGRAQFQIVLSYATGRPILVNIHANCGSVQRGESVRRLTSLKKLLNFWEAT
jgi:hypothetical protein